MKSQDEEIRCDQRSVIGSDSTGFPNQDNLSQVAGKLFAILSQ